MSKNDDLRSKSATLGKELLELRKAQFGLRMQLAPRASPRTARSSACAGKLRACTPFSTKSESEREMTSPPRPAATNQRSPPARW